MKRPKHQDNDIEAVIANAETHGWTFTVTGTQFFGKCGCGKHTHFIQQGKRATWRTAKNLRSQLMSCWR